MKRTSKIALLTLLLILSAVWMGCEGTSGPTGDNLEPNTRISAGPPERSDTGYTVNLFWFGWDDDGFVDHYEIAWEDTSEWIGPIFSNDSLFAVQVAASCCTDPIPAFGIDLQDSVYEQFHTFFVRAVDNRGVPDATPAVRSFNAKTVAPYTEIRKGPRPAQKWGTTVRFTWEGFDDDGIVESFLYALVTREQYRWGNNGATPNSAADLVTWVDTLTYRPLSNGDPDLSDPVWQSTTADSVVFESLPETASDNTNDYAFVVRAVDDAGATERRLDVGTNSRGFNTAFEINGPAIFISSNVVGSWSATSNTVHEVFASQGLKFTWRANPNAETQAEVVGYSYSIDDTTGFVDVPYSLNRTMFPEPVAGDTTEQLWRPSRGPHALFVRAIDDGRFISQVAARIEVFPGPRTCGTDQRFILVVRDSDTSALSNVIFPAQYAIVESTLVSYYFEGYDYQVHQTFAGREEPEVNLMNCASSVFWFHSASMSDGESSSLETLHATGPNSLPSYVAAGGNLFLCGLQPANAVAYFDNVESGQTELQNYPIIFGNTGEGTDFAEHWFKRFLFIQRIVESIANTTQPGSVGNRMAMARSQVSDYPDLVFDPTSWPSGPLQGGFGYYDREILLQPGSPAQVIYTRDATGSPVGIRRLTTPGVNGNIVYVGFHPYFVERPAFRTLIRTVLSQFGEFPTPGN